jgi:protein phosphatase
MINICSKTDIGKIRSVNEDRLLVKRFGDAYLLAVADGIGGHAGGELASITALKEVEDFFEKNLDKKNLKDLMEDAISKANEKVLSVSNENPGYAKMGTTLVMAFIDGNRTLISNIGDSRAYCVGEEIKRITKDHSLVQQMLDRKVITDKEAFDHPQKNIITQAMGSKNKLKPDFYDLEPTCAYLLLCSDGLTDYLKDMEIKKIIINSKSLELACAGLVDKANEKGGKDNITVILAKL